jgi:hypothetical protein
VAAISLVLAALVLMGGFAAYWFLFSSHRYVGTYKLKTVSTMGITVEMDQLGQMMGTLGGSSGGPPPTIEVLLELKGDGTGSMTSTMSGLSGPLAAAASAAGAGTSQSTAVKWHTEGRAIVVDADLSAAAAANPLAMGMGGGGSTAMGGKLEKGTLTLSADQPNPLASGQTLTTSMTFVRK